MERPSSASHSQILLSRPAAASVRPSGLQTTRFIHSFCSITVLRRCPFRLSHSLTEPSQLALANVLSSEVLLYGAKARLQTQLECPLNVRTRIAGVAGTLFLTAHSRIVPSESPLASSAT